MPKSAQRHAIARQWKILQLLPARPPGITAPSLTRSLQEEGFAVTIRTVQRDLEELSLSFGLRRNDQAKPFGWHWMQSRGFDLPGIEITDALSLAVMEESLRHLVPASLLRVLEPKFRQAKDKLRATQNNRYARWTDRVRYLAPGLQLRPPAVNPKVLETVQNALMEKEQIIVNYLGIDAPKSKKLHLHPLAYIQLGPVGYLAATAFDYSNPYLYALHRIHSAELSGEPARSPPDFSVDAFIAEGGMEFGKETSIRLTAVVESDLASRLTETPLADDQSIDFRKKGYCLTATVRDSWLLTFWILSQGDKFIVLNPKGLRDRIRRSLEATLKRYDET